MMRASIESGPRGVVFFAWMRRAFYLLGWGCFWFGFGFGLLFRWHPRFVSVLHALPLCGAAPTFLCGGKEK
ncbi:hypothetical protein PCAR4_1030001 [Paraburkholderia caribensis]|nr:hypothetical protein PCAR4_1030001 [Paraburkholderia caribensis]